MTGRWWRTRDASGVPATHRRLYALVAVGLVVAVLRVTPVNDGDAGEYLLMTESLFRHGTPDLRPADVVSVARHDTALDFGLNYAGSLRGYYDAPGGAWYCYHFWGYPLLAVRTMAVRCSSTCSCAVSLRCFPAVYSCPSGE